MILSCQRHHPVMLGRHFTYFRTEVISPSSPWTTYTCFGQLVSVLEFVSVYYLGLFAADAPSVYPSLLGYILSSMLKVFTFETEYLFSETIYFSHSLVGVFYWGFQTVLLSISNFFHVWHISHLADSSSFNHVTNIMACYLSTSKDKHTQTYNFTFCNYVC
jgi:hypothetical protein